ncbi:MAG: cysteine synthase A [Synergistaceae bacterium]|nr:cysteine synthase A [Synergistaceae bacterium]MBP9559738.1 cysteine synthase A [Synergistaceae bacterium]MBP9975624.1 cysteine synthase A [Synergistaceae bacterium]
MKVDDIQILKLIGNTPLYKLKTKTGGAGVWIKLEGSNPGGSIKDRAVWGMLKMAELKGDLKSDTVLVEPTSGNTGIGLALLGRAMGLRVVLTMPESMSVERRTILSSFGAELILTPAREGMQGSVNAACEFLSKEKKALMLDQFSNEGNPWAHEMTTGPEILRQIPKDKKIAAFVAGFGTGGTVSGVGKVLRSEFPDVRIIAVEPLSSPIVTEGRSGPHKIQGIGANFVPKNLNRSTVARFERVSDEDALATARWLAAEEGLFSGISTGANVWAALQEAKKLSEDSIVVTVQPDRGDKYLSIFSA